MRSAAMDSSFASHPVSLSDSTSSALYICCSNRAAAAAAIASADAAAAFTPAVFAPGLGFFSHAIRASRNPRWTR